MLYHIGSPYYRQFLSNTPAFKKATKAAGASDIADTKRKTAHPGSVGV